MNASKTARSLMAALLLACLSWPQVPLAQTVTVVPAIEYHHADFDHYFITAIPDEIAKLDAGIFEGWTRTGLQFNVFASEGAPPGSQEVCRFFSTQFVPSSHFYTNLAGECAGVLRNAAWQFEGKVFNVVGAEFTAPGYCPTGTAPVYRQYNGGRGGAPNHRYTTSRVVAHQMQGAGWCAEGYGSALDPRNPDCDPALPAPSSPPGVAFCAPL
jgi:hypothetical protein